MKTNTLKILGFVLALCAGQAFAGGGGSGVGGGGTAIILPDDTVVLADPFVVAERYPTDKELGDRVTLAPEVVEELHRVIRIMEIYGDFRGSPDQNTLRQSILKADYRMVNDLSEITRFCNYDAPEATSAPEGSKQIAVGCTRGNITWLVSPVIRKMNVRETSLTILHERLRNTEMGNSLVAKTVIAKTVTSVGMLLDLLNRQLKGERPVLSNEQLHAIDDFRFHLSTHWVMGDSKENRWFGYYQVYPQGGGLVFVGDSSKPNLPIRGNAYIGIASRLGDSHYINDVHYRKRIKDEDQHNARSARFYNSKYRQNERELKRNPLGIDSESGTVEMIYTGNFCGNMECWLQDGAILVDLPDQLGSYYSSESKKKTRITLDQNARLENVRGSGVSHIQLSKGASLKNVEYSLYGKSDTKKVIIRLLENASVSNLKRFGFVFDSREINVWSNGVQMGGVMTAFALNAPVVGLGLLSAVGLQLGHNIAGNTKGYVLQFEPETKIDLEPGERLCSDYVYDTFKDQWGFKAQVRSKEELAQRCQRKQ